MRRLALLLLLLPPAPAHAQWSAPQPVAGPHLFVEPRALVVGETGTVMALWSWQDGIGAGARSGTSVASRAGGAAAFGDQRPGRGTLLAGPVAYASSRTVLLTGSELSLSVRFGRTTGSIGAARTVARAGRRIARPAVAANHRGIVAVAWFEDRGTANDRVIVRIRRQSGAWERPVRLAQERVRSVSVAVGPRGEVLVAWDAYGKVRARLKPRGHRAFGRANTIRAADAFGADLRTAVNGAGRAIVAWHAQFRSEGGTVGGSYVQAAVRPVGARRFRGAELLERGGRGPIEISDTGPRDFLAAWTGAGGEIRSAVTGRGARFGAPQTLDPRESRLTSLAGGAGADEIATWLAPGGQVVAAVRHGGAWRAPERVATAADAGDPLGVVDPRTDTPIVVWAARPAPRQTRLYASIRG